jgi:parvulin-like peptidyl-prolyl isomerase
MRKGLWRSMAAVALSALLSAWMVGCGGSGEGGGERAAGEPDQITVQHILIGYKGSVPGKNITRTATEARTLAHELLERAQAGEDFDALVAEYTNDSPPGIYKMANRGVAADPSQQVFPRDGMVPAFGDVGFSLEVGEIGMSEYDHQKSPYGWHIIKRLK